MSVIISYQLNVCSTHGTNRQNHVYVSLDFFQFNLMRINKNKLATGHLVVNHVLDVLSNEDSSSQRILAPMLRHCLLTIHTGTGAKDVILKCFCQPTNFE